MKRAALCILLAAACLAVQGLFPKEGASAMSDEPGTKGKIMILNAEKGVEETVEPVSKSEAEWKKELDPEVFRVTQKKGTERPFTGRWNKNKGKGIYECVRCGTDLFSSEDKFDSGTGWPSFTRPVDPRNVELETDRSFFMRRIEVLCRRCAAHLGHVFDDGPAPTGKRYCINSVSLNFVPKE